jgi:glucose/arabinose dehydrogenase
MKTWRNQLISILSLIFLFATLNLALAENHDFEWTFGSLGNEDYVLNSSNDSELGPIGATDPTLPLHIGLRYQVTVENFNFHPFEVISKGVSFSEDAVLLSMNPSVEGSFEADSDVNWENDGSGSVRFTFTQALYESMTQAGQMPGYRCGVHTSDMRGDFNILGLPLFDPIPEPVEKGPVTVGLKVIAAGLTSPVDLKPVKDGTNRLLIADQDGEVYLIKDGVLLDTPFLDISDRLVSLNSNYDERGLLGIALHPGFADSESPGYRKIFTYSSEPVNGTADFTTSPLPEGVSMDHQSVLAEWMLDSENMDRIDPSTRREVMRIDQPQSNHNGGMLVFVEEGSLTGNLLIGLGDGGGANDVGPGHSEGGNAQDISNIYGSIVMIDPLDPSETPTSPNPISNNGGYRIPVENPFVGTDGVDEIFMFGLRNPYRFSIEDGVVIGDVGQNHVEEINFSEAAGTNFGWNLKEGLFRFDPLTGNVTDDLKGLPEGLTDPALQYDHDEGMAVVAGHTYQGSSIDDLSGMYVFGDFSRIGDSPGGRLFYAGEDSTIRELTLSNHEALNLYIKGFGIDAADEVYALTSPNQGPAGSGGLVMKLVPPGETFSVFYPHVASDGIWETEISIINTAAQPVFGMLTAYNSEGGEVQSMDSVIVMGNGRRQVKVGDEFDTPAEIAHIVFESDSDTVVGYTKFFIQGRYRAAVPAVIDVNAGEVFIPHIASDDMWWTGLSLVNTTASAKMLTIEFDIGETRTVEIPAMGHRAFTVAGLLGGQPQPTIESAVIQNGEGIVGLELFGSRDETINRYLSGVLLKDFALTDLYFPHVVSDDFWWTGLVAYNPSPDPVELSVIPYSDSGSPLAMQNLTIEGKGKFIGTADSLNLPNETGWFRLEADTPVTGFELFGTHNGNQMAGFTAVGISGMSGVFSKIEKEGWTGIAFVNTEDSGADITLTAYQDDGGAVASGAIAVAARQKVVNLVEDLFTENIDDADYVIYSSDKNVAGFQLNGSTDGFLLDGLPALR